MKGNITKEIIIMLLLIILIMLIMAVGLYEFVPSGISIPEGIEYNSDSKTVAIKQEIEYTNGGDATADSKSDSEELSTLLKSYTIDATDLAVYGEKKLYISGNSNPFDYGSEDSTSNADGNSTAENIELSAGKYTVGTEVKPGKYNVIAKAGHGNFYVKGSANEIMGVEESDEFYIKEYKNLVLKQGDEIEISGTLKVLLDSGNSATGGTASGNAAGGTTTGNTSSGGTSSSAGAGNTSGSSTGTFFESPNKK